MQSSLRWRQLRLLDPDSIAIAVFQNEFHTSIFDAPALCRPECHFVIGLLVPTDLLSELKHLLLTPSPNTAVLEWLVAQPPLSVFTTAVTEAEILSGLRLLPEGRRRRDLERPSRRFLARTCSDACCCLIVTRRIFMPPSPRIVATPADPSASSTRRSRRSRGASVATRNVSDLEGLGLVIVNPWKDH